jgi:23S rRNA (uracil1939-C5)-methyltransferase
MPLSAGQELELSIDKPAAGGRMIARHAGQVVLVHGAIPGERVLARIERAEKQVAFAATVKVVEPSEDRQRADVDLLCGGCLYAHIRYPRQLRLKGEVVQDAFGRLGRIPLPAPLDVAGSPERGYRMRARLHAQAGRIGFYREGTHELCDAAPTRQLRDDAVGAAVRAAESLERGGCPLSAVEIAENIAADERVLHVTAAPGATLAQSALDAALKAGELTGCTGWSGEGTVRTAGIPVVADPLPVLTAGRATSGTLSRHASSFFQANRFLLPRLVTSVIDSVAPNGDVLDLYAGVGLFSVALAAVGYRGISAVEGDRSSGSDLQRNAASCGAAVRVWTGSVEEHLARRRGPAPSTVIVDPPRTGISRVALQAIAGLGAGRIVYVSCDPATMARDARRLLDAEYRMSSLAGFDLFPNTPHVEVLGVFER